jgi:hypothetical protein
MSALVFKRTIPSTFSTISKITTPIARYTTLYSHNYIRMASTQTDAGKPPFPPFTLETAQIKVKAAQDLWNTK